MSTPRQLWHLIVSPPPGATEFFSWTAALAAFALGVGIPIAAALLVLL